MKMNKLITKITALLLLVFCSCENYEEDMLKKYFTGEDTKVEDASYSLYVDINTMPLVQNLINPNGNVAYFVDGAVNSSYEVRTRFYIYDSNGNYVNMYYSYGSTFNQTVAVESVLPAGKYTLVTVVDISSGQADHVWSVANDYSLSTAKITLGGYSPMLYGILGFNKQTITLSQNSSLDITPVHLGSLYSICFSNVDYTTIRYIYYAMNIDPDSYTFDTKVFSRDQSYYQHNELDYANMYTSYYTTAYLLPKSGLVLNYQAEDVYKSIVGTAQTISITSGSNSHKNITINVATKGYTSYSMAPRKQTNVLFPDDDVQEKGTSFSIGDAPSETGVLSPKRSQRN
jgi:hypothetical protein